MVSAQDDFGPVFQDWRPRRHSDFDIQVLDPCGEDVRAALQGLLRLVSGCNRLKVEKSEFRHGVLAVCFFIIPSIMIAPDAALLGSLFSHRFPGTRSSVSE